jgi:hypothetical protein
MVFYTYGTAFLPFGSANSYTQVGTYTDTSLKRLGHGAFTINRATPAILSRKRRKIVTGLEESKTYEKFWSFPETDYINRLEDEVLFTDCDDLLDLNSLFKDV